MLRDCAGDQVQSNNRSTSGEQPLSDDSCLVQLGRVILLLKVLNEATLIESVFCTVVVTVNKKNSAQSVLRF